MSLRSELQYLHDICRCITVSLGMSIDPCGEQNCVRCRLKPLIASLPQDPEKN